MTTTSENNAMSVSVPPTVCIIIGMAGSGKTTLLQRLNSHLHSMNVENVREGNVDNHLPPCHYIVNLDPAVKSLPFNVNIDIRDTINYKEVMNKYKLGPNGAIVTSLNLFATRFDQLLSFVDKRAPMLKYVLLDTPGQIEVFTWSASGTIITETLASSYPTVIVYVIDTSKCTSPTTFMSNMLYACSILYKTKLPLILAFNKVDIVPYDFAKNWMTDFDAFQAALKEDEHGNNEGYINNLTHSMSLMLEEFYRNLKCVGVSAITGSGMEDFFAAVNEATAEYQTEYKPEIERLKSEKKKEKEKLLSTQIERLKKEMIESKGQSVVLDARSRCKCFSKHENNRSSFLFVLGGRQECYISR